MPPLENMPISLVRARSADGPSIWNIDDWRTLAGPKRPEIQWQDFRSAKELAQSWLRGGTPGMPTEYSMILHTHPLTRRFEPVVAVAEAEIAIDEFFGPRNSDLVVIGTASRQPIVIAVEAKADESFAEEIDQELQNLPAGSNKPTRVERLALSVLNRPLDLHVRSLRYQLLHSLAATAIEAKRRQAKLGVLLIHEFISLTLDFDQVTRNASDLKAFVNSVPGWEKEQLKTGKLLPPIALRPNDHIPGDQLVTIGKVRTLIPLDAGDRDQIPSGFYPGSRQFVIPSPSTHRHE